MRKVDIPAIHDAFEAEIQALSKRANRIKRRLAGKRRGEADTHWLLEMALVSACTRWERFTERLFYAYLNRDSSRLSRALGLKLPKNLTDEMCEALFTTRGYMDVRGVDQLIGLGKKYLVTSPFTRLSRDNRRMIERAFGIRNLVVHQSRVAKRLLRQRHQVKRRPGIHLVAVDQGAERLFRYLDSMLDGSTQMRPLVAIRP